MEDPMHGSLAPAVSFSGTVVACCNHAVVSKLERRRFFSNGLLRHGLDLSIVAFDLAAPGHCDLTSE
jgi:hypothetical protein